MSFLKYATLTFALLLSNRAVAGKYPMGFSIFAPSKNVYWQAPAPESSVCGLRIGLIRSLNESVCGIDLGFLISETREKFSGISLSGLANISHGEEKIYLIQAAGLMNQARGAKIWGIQFAFGVNNIRDEAKVTGIQAAIIGNISPKANVLGIQIGAVNRALVVRGFQIGILNIAGELTGIQIGLLNFNKIASPLFFFPGINIGF